MAGNTGGNCAGTLTDDGYNLEDTSPSTCGFSAADHDVVGENPELGALQVNGGPTDTQSATSTSSPPSPAYDAVAASSGYCSGNDQRGVPYLQGSATACSIGAYQYAPPNITTISPGSGLPAGGNTVTLTGYGFTLATEVNFGSTTFTAGQFTVTGDTTVTVTAPSGTAGTTVNVSVVNPDGTSNTVGYSYAASPPTINKSFGASSIPLGGSTSLSFTITNPNSGAEVTGVGFTDTLPAGMVVANPNGATTPCTGFSSFSATPGAGSVGISGFSLPANASCNFSVNVTATTAGVKNNSVTVTSDQGTGNTATATLTVVAPPTISKSFGASSIPLGGTTSLSFTITNPNSGTSLTGVGFTDPLPSGLVVATPSNGLTGSCGSGTIVATPDSSSISLSGATLAASASCTFSVNVIGVGSGVQNNTTSAVSSNDGGAGTPASASTTVNGCPNKETAHLVTANTNVGTILGVWCVSKTGQGTYQQGTVSGTGALTINGSSNAFVALGPDVNVGAGTSGPTRSFTETLPIKAKGTYTLG